MMEVQKVEADVLHDYMWELGEHFIAEFAHEKG